MMENTGKQQAEICYRVVTSGDNPGANCPWCGHNDFIHPGVANDRLAIEEGCSGCRLEVLISEGEQAIRSNLDALRGERTATSGPENASADYPAPSSGAELTSLLRGAGDKWGPMGVALAAAQLTDHQALADRLSDIGNTLGPNAPVGAVGYANVRGHPGVFVVRSGGESAVEPWFTAEEVGGSYDHTEEQVHSFERWYMYKRSMKSLRVEFVQRFFGSIKEDQGYISEIIRWFEEKEDNL